MPLENPSPTVPEIKEQLERMLISKRFRNAVNQAAFLSLVVNRALAGKRTSETTVGKALFRKKFIKDETSDVRVTAGSLRKSLTKYFENEGRDEPVRIFLPEPPTDKSLRPAKGEAYTPKFTYHPFQAVSFSFRMAQVLLPRDLQAAIDMFKGVIDHAPQHTGALIGLAEAWCCATLYASGENYQASADELSKEALCLLEKVAALAPRSWKVFAVIGFLLTQMERLDLAKEAFASAHGLSPVNTESYPPYMAYLVKTGDAERAVHLADRCLEAHLSDPHAYVVYADVLLRAGNWDEAAHILHVALKVHGNVGLVHQRLFVIRFAQRRLDEAVIHGNQMARSLDPLVLEATLELARNAVATWPEGERIAWEKRMEIDRAQETAMTRASARVRASSK